MSGGSLIREMVRRSMLAARRRAVYLPSGTPGAPQIGTATKGNGEATITFSPPTTDGGSPITSYTATSSPGAFTATGAGSPLTVTGLTNGVSYTFTVTATNGVGVGVPSATSNAVVPSTVPSAPTVGTAAVAAIGAITVPFTPGADGGAAASSFTVTSSPGGLTAAGAASPLTVTGLTPGQAYTFTVTATNINGTSAASAASNSVTAVGVPDAPTIGTPTPASGQVSVAFTPPGNNGGSAITSYTAYASTGQSASGASSPIIVTGLTNGVSVDFYVTATNAYGTSGPSDTSALVLPAGVPSAPVIIGVTRGNGQVSISYEPSASNGAAVTSYTATSSPGGTQTSGLSNPLVLNGLTNGTAYTFTMTATNSVGTSAQSNTSAAVTPATVPGAPTIGTATAGDASASVAFTPPASNGGSAITGYTVTASPGGATATGTASPITVFGLQNGLAHTFTVVATNAVGNSAASAASNSVTPQQSTTVPGAPTIGTAARSASGACTVSFTPPANNGGSAITGYTATSSPGGLTGTASSSPITVSGLTNGTSYTFTVTATNSNGTGPASASSNAAIPATVPSAPAAPVATGGNAQASLTFSAPANGGSAITSYTGVSSPGGISRTMTAAELALGPMVITGLANGTAYTFTVYATNQYGNGSASPASNAVTPAAGGSAGPFDSLYTAGWMPISDTTVYTTPVESEPAKSTGIANVSYTDQRYGTKVFRMTQPSDSPGNPTGKMRHEYSRRQPWNCNMTKFIVQNGNGFFFVYDADTFARLEGGVTTVDAKQYAVGTNSIHPKDPRDWSWHPTDPNKIIFFPQNDGLILYEFDVVTKVLTTKANFTGRLGVFGTVTKLAMLEGRPSDDVRYWGWQVFNGTATVGYMTWDMQTDTITGTLVTSDAANNTTMSSSGQYIVISAGGAGLTIEQCAASPNIRGTRAYTRDFSSFKQVHLTTTHGDVGYDTLGREVYISLNPGSSSWTAIPTNSLYMIPLSGTEGPTMLVNLGSASTQWNSHYSATSAPLRPGWTVLSMWDSAVRGTQRWLDNTVSLVELKANPRVFRLIDHRVTLRYTYWQEPHSCISPDGLRVMNAIAWDATSTAKVASAYMVGLPSWVYGTSGGGAPPTPPAGNNMVTNGDFATSLTGWEVTAGGWVYSAGKAQFVSGTGASSLRQPVTMTAGKAYKITFNMSNYTGPGDLSPRLTGGTSVIGPNINGDGAKEVILTAVSGNTHLSFNAFSTFNGAIDNVVMAEAVTNIIGNGNFNDATGWTLGASCTVTGGVLHCNNNAANVTNSYAVGGSAGTYRVTYDIVAPFNAGNITARFDTSAGVVSGATRSFGSSSAGTYTEDIVLTGSINAFEFRVTRSGGTSMDCRLDNLVVEKIA